jgi:hypothetical protein
VYEYRYVNDNNTLGISVAYPVTFSFMNTGIHFRAYFGKTNFKKKLVWKFIWVRIRSKIVLIPNATLDYSRYQLTARSSEIVSRPCGQKLYDIWKYWFVIIKLDTRVPVMFRIPVPWYRIKLMNKNRLTFLLMPTPSSMRVR